MSFAFKGAEAGWVTAQRCTNECVPRVVVLLSIYTMYSFIALSCVSMAHGSAVSESVLCGGKDQDLKGPYLLAGRVTLNF